jgi:hypothetical protein
MKDDKAELRIVEVNKPFAPAKVARLVPRVDRRSPPTRAEALEAIRAMRGSAALFERLPALGQVEAWNEAAQWNICQSTGAAVDGVFIWDCDFPGVAWSTFDGYANCIAYFSGAEALGGVVPPQPISGQVWCYLDAGEGVYVFGAQVETYTDEYYGPDYVAVVEFCMDDQFLGTRTLVPGVAATEYFAVSLSAGLHRFLIRQISGSFFFQSLTAWPIAIKHVLPNLETRA